MITGKTAVTGLIGNPVAHTMSPLIHNTLAADYSVDLTYMAFPVVKDLKSAVDGAYALGILGLNVTVPYKQAVMSFLKDTDEEAQKIAAVNTLVRDEEKGGWKGYNTDLAGLRYAFRCDHADPAGRDAVLIGAGGAARTVAYCLASSGVRSLYILNRTAEHAQQLAADIGTAFPGLRVKTAGTDEAGSLPVKDAFAVQATSAGLAPHNELSPVTDPAFFDKLSYAFDLIYRPDRTVFLKMAEAAGCRVSNGLGMLLGQATASFALWTGLEPDEAETEKIAHLLRRNYVLTGFMGSGKTTVGRTLADMAGLQFCDLDELLEKREGRTISAIFEAEGETGFREKETAQLRELAEKQESGLVFATGGGIVGREENRALLRKLGTVIWLRERPETVLARLSGDTSRPLLQGEDKQEKVRRLMEERSSLYNGSADTVIDVDELTPRQIAARILDNQRT
jgi:shikimate dehydrogenase